MRLTYRDRKKTEGKKYTCVCGGGGLCVLAYFSSTKAYTHTGHLQAHTNFLTYFHRNMLDKTTREDAGLFTGKK